jgi:Transposase DDE domain
MSSSYRSSAVGATFRQFLHGFLHTDDLPFRDALTASQIEQAATADKVSFGTGANDVYSVPVTLWAFIAQVLSDQKSCLAAVARVLVLLATLGRKPCGAGTGAYCKARTKLPERFLQRLTCDVGCRLEAEAPDAWRWHGHRVVLLDGSTLSMPDTEANQKAYPQQRSQKPGVGFPVLRWVALLGLATAAVLASAFGPWRGKETGETALFRTLLDYLRPGDVLVADRSYCSYWVVAAALAHDGQVVFRKHHLRHTDFRTGRRLGRNDHVVTWTKPQRPAWMGQAEYEALPATLTLREVRTRVSTPGCRVKELVVVTTLLDPGTYPLEDILDLYHERWHVEIDLRSIKTQMKMEILRRQTPEMVRKEIWAHLLAYNLVRKVMAQAAQEHGVTPRQLSFAGAMQTLNEFRTLLLTSAAAELPALCDDVLKAIASHRVGNRPDRCEPRKVKRRPKGYSRILKPRAEERAACLKG